jgi:hypothetical protein
MLAAAALVLTACSDTMVTPTTPIRAAPTRGNFDAAVAGLPAVVLSGADLGAFTNTTSPAELTRVTGAFWDNISSDDTPFPGAHSKCNIGFFVTGAIVPGTCLLQAGGTVFPVGFGGTYWGDNGPLGTSAGRDPSSFTFSGAYGYDIALIGAFHGNPSELGYFIHDAFGYHFFPQPLWSTVPIVQPNVVHITPGSTFGLYIGNGALDHTNSCQPGSGRACSDATGGFTSGPFQQFSLFRSGDGNKLIAGVEDNGLSPLWNGPDPVNNPTNKDSDYQDWIFSITPVALDHHGCTLGFWKNHDGGGPQANLWPSPYNPATTTLGGAGFLLTGNQGTLMDDALSFKGGPSVQDAKNLLMKQAVAALLNAATPGMFYPLDVAHVISETNTALATGDRGKILDEAARLGGFNSLEGPLC